MLGSSSFVRGAGLAAIVAGVMLARAPDARACGGCFHQPPPQQTVVDTVITDHRMVFSVSTTQTVLWDQVRYSGNADAFAWVLPVKPGTTIALSHDEWIASLDAATATVIQGPTPSCGGSAPVQDVGGGAGGCGASSESAASGLGAEEDFDAGASADGSTVQVVSEQVVGPYDTVTVRSSQGQALGDWLRANGYDVPTSLQPVIDAFTSEGFDFIALKLAPNEGVQAMQPVRVVTPGADLSLPLRMVAAGVGANVGLELYVLGEGIYQPQNFPVASVDFSQLAWDPNNQISNYTTLASNALAQNGGTSWIVETAGPVALGYSNSPGGNPPLDTTYESTCVPQVFIPAGCGEDGGGPDETDGGEDGGADAGSCAPTTIACDDLQVAMTGIEPGSFIVTRLRAQLPSTALANDLVLEASPSQDAVPSFHVTQQYTVPDYNPCPSSSNGASSSNSSQAACATAPRPGARYTDVIVACMVAIGIAFGARRRRRS